MGNGLKGQFLTLDRGKNNPQQANSRFPLTGLLQDCRLRIPNFAENRHTGNNAYFDCRGAVTHRPELVLAESSFPGGISFHAAAATMAL